MTRSSPSRRWPRWVHGNRCRCANTPYTVSELTQGGGAGDEGTSSGNDIILYIFFPLEMGVQNKDFKIRKQIRGVEVMHT